MLANLGLDTIPASTFPTTNLVNFTVSNCLLDSLPTDLLSMTKLKYLYGSGIILLPWILFTSV